MNGPELPQPIYPSGGPPSAGPGGFAGGPSSGAQPGGGTPGNKAWLLAAGALAVILVAVLVFVFTNGDDDDDGSALRDRIDNPGGTGGGDNPDPSSPGTSPTEPAPGVVEAGSGPSDRALRVAAVQIPSTSQAAVSCMAEGFDGAPDVLDIIEAQPDGVALTDGHQADTYAVIVMRCITPTEISTHFSQYLNSAGYDSFCFDYWVSDYTVEDWEAQLSALVQPAYAPGELQRLTTC